MKFKFPLQKVLQHRKVLEDLAQRDFQEAQAELTKQQQILQGMLDLIMQARDNAFQTQSQGGTAGAALFQVHEFIKGQNIRVERQQEKIKELEKIAEHFRDILKQKAIDHKIIVEFKQRRLEEFKVEQNKREQKINDDMSLMRFRPEDMKE